jgi:hypothetical protein
MDVTQTFVFSARCANDKFFIFWNAALQELLWLWNYIFLYVQAIYVNYIRVTLGMRYVKRINKSFFMLGEKNQ